MKRSVLWLLALLVSSSAWAQTKEINFRKGTVAEILAQAKAEKKPIFIDAYTTWCGPCKWMDKNVFVNDAVAEYFNTNFVNYKLDMEKGEGIEMAKKYEVQAYPSFLFLAADGSVMHRTVGARPAEMFMDVATIAKDPAKNFASYQKKFEGGERSADFMMGYLKVLNEAALDAGKVAEAYFATQKSDQLLERGNWKLIYENINTVESPTFTHLVKNREAFAKKYTADSVNNKILSVYGMALNRAAYEGKDAEFTKLKTDLTKLNLKDAERSVLFADAVYYERKQDLPKYHAANTKLYDTYFSNDANRLNTIAWKYYETIEDKAMLQKAEEWARKSVSIAPGYANLDTHAALLYKLGQKQKALEAANKAIAAGKKNGDDVTGTEELLAQIKKM
ncbi:thioredoxin family protein [Pontibacter sp. BT310]|uniref:Thioredoxin family protein n=1 Tax=Pontibacter populi TaxID=890055 RepID=A0ABS6XCS3_9BACT|nr:MULTISPECIES: thioredoxin family protein [Pontibacter]MBJ6118444.1 thioredoxin family protein [Pontibacter sp. BT310]MBR0570872.1 thioredoxin family protein [Microvirga sp. STS03]MBW3365298.1 thioredoxin family protein [Pontibacter populi]